jgi:hypothetical protein
MIQYNMINLHKEMKLLLNNKLIIPYL